MAGDSATPAVPGYGSGLSADLYTGNGILDEHAHLRYGTLGVLVEMSTCQTASAADPTDAWEPAGCANAFLFPDDEALIEAEFRKNLPFALATARSAADPADPVDRHRTAGARVRGRQLRRVLRRPADGGRRPPGATSTTSASSTG